MLSLNERFSLSFLSEDEFTLHKFYLDFCLDLQSGQVSHNVQKSEQILVFIKKNHVAYDGHRLHLFSLLALDYKSSWGISNMIIIHLHLPHIQTRFQASRLHRRVLTALTTIFRQLKRFPDVSLSSATADTCYVTVVFFNTTS